MIFTRHQLEELEEQFLAPYAIRSKDSKGRKQPEDEPDYRTVFQRDRDRILHTNAFRRLEYKARVFINDEGDHHRSRLAHTLEVAQIGRSIARALGANEDLVETISLAVDLGHPPLGSAGERALARLMVDHGGFNHVRHAFHIVTKIENRYPEFDGLNLTWEVVEGIVKRESEHAPLINQDFDPKLRGHLEAQITNVADELACTANDLDDGLRSGMITADQLAGISLWEVVNESIGRRRSKDLDDLARHQLIRRLISIEITDLIQSIDRMIRRSGIRTVEELQKLPYNVAGFSEDMHRRNRELKDFLYKNLYKHFRVTRMAVKAERIIEALFNTFVAEPATLPPQYQKMIDELGLEHTVCEYIAGMTDGYAIGEYQKLFDPKTIP
ncbi:MAG TPA: deoxyguanosinetriphosphate triphosphohydrolase [Brevefilum fermentans]|jgi:dGTPase|uniref:Deoxyguanosinetriphosphate triphosphohydrolase-like protein n=1 Tax=Candidatus Brevifilum fermentans TaxID=1986204 RepID=A0A1Y6K835_9CHLR|nr:deoxyguanosinetriphosphate triphosphohydrolase [Brevefilum fermentans]MDI9566641.1 deoxyguanosinetriphosphate triphosphohydrolase [Chloroflexota bacterium]OQB83395.1 MAG: Deoxyguanosinetriphosphate triphosphohydrolase [Chloroflexi bacterium ADurb.Bin120]SMX54759.1 Deoxyguanosinetriphosphate triphosphohydrolase-like protein [Brevefilum fermentans]HOM66440.1 deoxyguanosinetriphosphate triphosphohydrolase [Brevefilum fermentans]HPX95069.1 deoxyguanosinetriphosphate triphosphohydrolase [Brevefi